jgi:hypothetical protein
MSDLRELTNAELDRVSAGSRIAPSGAWLSPEPTGGVKLVEEITVDTLRLLEPNNRKAPQPAQFWPTPGVC